MKGEIIAPGAFKKVIKSKAIIDVLHNHNKNKKIGHLTNMEETDKGLWVEGLVSDKCIYGREFIKKFESKPILGLSMGFIPWKEVVRNGTRMLLDVALLEVSFVHFPLQPDAKVYQFGEQKILV